MMVVVVLVMVLMIRAAASTQVLVSTRFQKLRLNFLLLVKFYFRLQVSASVFNFCKLNYRFVAICANLNFAFCTLISFNLQLRCSILVLRVAYTGNILPKY